MVQEQSFFSRCLEQLSPGWSITLDPAAQPGSLDLAGRTARLYLIDSSTSWTTAGAFAPAVFAVAAAAATAAALRGSSLADAAGQMLSRLSSAGATSGADVSRCLQLVAAALANTQTFAMVQAQGAGLAGHWVYLAYRAHDASVICRPLFFRSGAACDSAGFAPPHMLMSLVRQAVAHDTRAPSSAVGKLLRRSGGAILAPAFV